jgi:cellulose synthase/poly-beta-1,6-N-acetylglucosamine synthase-like glycosyltransferase
MTDTNIWHYEGDYLFLPPRMTAKKLTGKSMAQHFLIATSIFLFLTFILSTLLGASFFVVFSGLLALIYGAALAFKIIAVATGIIRGECSMTTISDSEVEATPHESPLYRPCTVLIPLYREAEVISQIKKAMTSLDYPEDRLEFLITLEEYDHETREEILKNNLPKNFRIITLPDVRPKTKPKALNVAFGEVKGEYTVIFDAEIIPDRYQLKKAALAFAKRKDIAAFQSRLDHYNAETNIITGLFNAEFASYYDMFLPGLAVLGVPFPLSGHSTYFRTDALKAIGGWDPYNVTEDVDIAIRLARHGYKTGVLNAFSQEEATTTIWTWIMQRTRWMKGFLQTSLVHMRNPFIFVREIGGLWKFVAFLLLVPGSTMLNLLNLFYISLTMVWLLFHPPIIQSFFTTPILYLTYSTTIIGVTLSVFLNLLSLYRRNRFHIVMFAYLSPLYWILLSVAAVRAVYQFFIDPISWEKTVHGTHIAHSK